MKKLLISIILLLAGAAIFVLGNPYYDLFWTNNKQDYYIALTVFFLALSISFNRIKALREFWRAAYALFIASAALLFFSTGLLNISRSGMPPLQDLAVDKLSQALHIIPVVIILTLAVKEDFKSIYLSRGNLKQGLIFGLISFLIFALITIWIGSSTEGYLSALAKGFHWVLLFVFVNALMEELWFRGIFLKKYAPLIGRIASILVTSLVFGISHINATYYFPGGGLVFGFVVFGLGVVGAWSMYKTDSLIGAVIFHAGYDLIVISSILDSL